MNTPGFGAVAAALVCSILPQLIPLVNAAGGARDLVDLLLSDAAAAIPPATWATAANAAPAASAAAAAAPAAAPDAEAAAEGQHREQSEAAPMETDAPEAGTTAAAGECPCIHGPSIRPQL